MGPLQAIASGVRKTFQYSGDASRSEYLWFVAFWALFPEVLGFVAAFPAGFMQGLNAARGVANPPAIDLDLATLLPPWSWLALCLPGLSLTIRRLRACERRIWWLGIVPFAFVALILAIAFYMSVLNPAAPEEIRAAGVFVGANLRYFLMICALPLLALLVGKSRPSPTLSETFK